jgi:prolyl-tRNA editing enzyme YbaK/EbsC (Cys-tRNA(Pro) deacylase)
MSKTVQSDRLKIFVGSSSEARAVYDEICSVLESQLLNVMGWTYSFVKGESYLNSLIAISESCDAALLIATPDDILHQRGDETPVIRDNVLFEAGLFIGALGNQNTSLVLVGDRKVRLPSDLDGIKFFSFNPGRKSTFSTEVREWVEKIKINVPRKHLERRFRERLRKIPSPFLEKTKDLLIPRVDDFLRLASVGIINLTSEQYYERIRFEIENACSGSRVMAVATSLSAVRWSKDPVQNKYIEENYLAKERGADVRRLFVLAGSRVLPQQAKNIRNHLVRGIGVRAISQESLETPLEDMVLFESESKEIRVYKAFLDRQTKERVVTAHLIVEPDHCIDLRRRFEEVWQIAWIPDTDGIYIKIPGMTIHPPSMHDFAPGLEMTPRWTAVEVVTCEEACKVRGHELNRELKSIILTTSRGLSVVHLSADRMVDLRKVKKSLGVAEARAADPEQLLAMEIGPGTVCAVLEPVWSMQHLVDTAIFKTQEMFTNNGTRNGYFSFDPDIFKSAKSVIEGDFCK